MPGWHFGPTEACNVEAVLFIWEWDTWHLFIPSFIWHQNQSCWNCRSPACPMFSQREKRLRLITGQMFRFNQIWLCFVHSKSDLRNSSQKWSGFERIRGRVVGVEGKGFIWHLLQYLFQHYNLVVNLLQNKKILLNYYSNFQGVFEFNIVVILWTTKTVLIGCWKINIQSLLCPQNLYIYFMNIYFSTDVWEIRKKHIWWLTQLVIP